MEVLIELTAAPVVATSVVVVVVVVLTFTSGGSAMSVLDVESGCSLVGSVAPVEHAAVVIATRHPSTTNGRRTAPGHFMSSS